MVILSDENYGNKLNNFNKLTFGKVINAQINGQLQVTEGDQRDK
jgi:hypothetical protein